MSLSIAPAPARLDLPLESLPDDQPERL